MPYDNSNYGGDDTDLHEPKTSAAKGGGEEEEEQSEQTALLPKTVLGGKAFKPGEEVVLKIVAVYEDEVEVEYATEEKSEPSKPMRTMDDSDANLDRMAMSEG